MSLRPVERQTLAQTVMSRLIDFIRAGGLRPGDALPAQHELAAQLAVSRPVLREALQGLAALGLIEIRPGSGCYVREPQPSAGPTLIDEFTHQSALEVLEARVAIEVELAGLAAERATAEDLARMEATLAKIRAAVEHGQITSGASYEFHCAVARAAHNRVLTRMVELLRPFTVAGGQRVEIALPDVVPHEEANHRRIFDAIRRRDARRARELMREHLQVAHGWEERIAELRRLPPAARGGRAGNRGQESAGPAIDNGRDRP